MRSLWNDKEVEVFCGDLLKLRVYTSRLLGRESDLVLHGGGNTSVKVIEENLFGESQELLYVKGSGWDLATIEAEGFAPVKLDVLKKMAALKELSDVDMVKNQCAAMTNPFAPNPSVEAILHAIIPFTFVDHTHTDSVVTITNTPNGRDRIVEIYGKKMLIIPYVMPGFILAKTVYDMTRDIDWDQCDGMVLMNHGVFTFDHDAKKSYEKMIDVVSKAEKYLLDSTNGSSVNVGTRQAVFVQNKHLNIARLRQKISDIKGQPMLVNLQKNTEAVAFSYLENIEDIATRGPLTPDHVIRTKRIPVIFKDEVEDDLDCYAKEYQKYFESHKTEGLICLDQAPRWAVWQGYGKLSFGRSMKELNIIGDITDHTIKAIEQAEQLGGWRALPQKDIFDVEYWELEQAKLKKGGKASVFQGKVALVTGAASGIGKACVDRFVDEGACVLALDINPDVKEMFKSNSVLGVACDLTNQDQVKQALEEGVECFGGLDVVVSNAGIFPASAKISDISLDTWNCSLNINLSSHQQLLKICIPYLELGIDPAVIVIASKNVPAPGPGAAAYSVAKAGLTQLARVAALELGASGIRVNVVHPNQIFDTAIWTDEVLESRAKHYKMSVSEYKRNNILKTEITSVDVASLVCTMAGPVFLKTTGVQIPIDGGNERVI